MKLLSETKMFGGQQQRYTHHSRLNHCDMTFSVYLPPQAENHKVPVLYWLSGLTCNDENFVIKAGAQRYAAEYGIAIVTPDTSPRGEGVPDDPDGAWDFGLGAGFYLNATQAPWSTHYQMYDYITRELVALIENNFPVSDKKSISGHSMGGHGALSIALKNPQSYCSVSAFSPIVNPIACPWGKKAFSNYLGADEKAWQQYDTCCLIEASSHSESRHLPMLIDQGSDDDFLQEQLLTTNLQDVCSKHNYPVTINMNNGYDHSYFFIASFIGNHIKFHARELQKL